MPTFSFILRSFLFSSILILLTPGCINPNTPDEPVDQFDRGAMLSDWASLIIVPGYNAYVIELIDLKAAEDLFQLSPGSNELDLLREFYMHSYKAWQTVSMFDIGKAEEIGLRNYTNIYPTDIEAIESNAISGTANLELPSNFDAQGFPALDYLLYGLADTEAEIIELLSTEYSDYLGQLVNRLFDLALIVSNDWQGSGFDTFVDNDGSSATASVDRFVNDYIFYYERFLRAGKVALPAGVFTGSELPHLVEAPYSRIYSKDLLRIALKATSDFFNGIAFHSQIQGVSLADYIDFIHSNSTVSDITTVVNAQWDVIESNIDLLQDDLYSQVETDNSKMLNVYDELQRNVVTLKVDMLQALNIQVDYVDADGD